MPDMHLDPFIIRTKPKTGQPVTLIGEHSLEVIFMERLTELVQIV